MKKLFLGLAIAAAPLMFAQKTAEVTVIPPKKELPAELSKEKVNLYNENLMKFLAALKISDRSAIDALLSDKVKTLATDEILNKVKDGIDYTKKLTVLKAGYYVAMDGEGLPNLKYKYADDSENKEVISVVFEDGGKILGVMPVNKN
ncbi:MAG: peptidylprolyl isomerase [Chryseobacterium sp.]|jgi:hypothetical protein|uniref:peptidylprolyl isomerase n=1 Tax=Chryseobacterium sp. TaxID=1871047 RepID=UPI00281DCC82|nr:peptidylprolyl isomerase [Chryseobacterium sp.]MDR2234885.1 peptidylprolyl isomerase [Chryseobacterium sp.]